MDKTLVFYYQLFFPRSIRPDVFMVCCYSASSIFNMLWPVFLPVTVVNSSHCILSCVLFRLFLSCHRISFL